MGVQPVLCLLPDGAVAHVDDLVVSGNQMSGAAADQMLHEDAVLGRAQLLELIQSVGRPAVPAAVEGAALPEFLYAADVFHILGRGA